MLGEKSYRSMVGECEHGVAGYHHGANDGGDGNDGNDDKDDTLEIYSRSLDVHPLTPSLAHSRVRCTLTLLM